VRVGVGLLVLAAVACTPPPRPPTPVAEATPGGRWLVGVFEGTLPCADCEGVRTRLTLWASGPHDFTDARYALAETYLGTREARRFRSEGTWTLLRGDADDPDATVYQLDPEKGDDARSFYVVDERHLEQLDRTLHRTRAATPPVLERVELELPAAD